MACRSRAIYRSGQATSSHCRPRCRDRRPRTEESATRIMPIGTGKAAWRMPSIRSGAFSAAWSFSAQPVRERRLLRRACLARSGHVTAPSFGDETDVRIERGESLPDRGKFFSRRCSHENRVQPALIPPVLRARSRLAPATYAIVAKEATSVTVVLHRSDDGGPNEAPASLRAPPSRTATPRLHQTRWVLGKGPRPKRGVRRRD